MCPACKKCKVAKLIAAGVIFWTCVHYPQEDCPYIVPGHYHTPEEAYNMPQIMQVADVVASATYSPPGFEVLDRKPDPKRRGYFNYILKFKD